VNEKGSRPALQTSFSLKNKDLKHFLRADFIIILFYFAHKRSSENKFKIIITKVECKRTKQVSVSFRTNEIFI
jgi:hypothetical protein